METKFTAWQDDTTLDFYGMFHGAQSSRLLYQFSGGERQLAAVSFQVVINRLFAAGVDWIALDEPSTHVDAAYRPKLVSAIMQMAGRPEFKDMQMVIVDHSVEFASSVSSPIMLQKQTQS
jgi:DNA repair exonuclease SbcCD ATPase subunit